MNNEIWQEDNYGKLSSIRENVNKTASKKESNELNKEVKPDKKFCKLKKQSSEKAAGIYEPNDYPASFTLLD